MRSWPPGRQASSGNASIIATFLVLIVSAEMFAFVFTCDKEVMSVCLSVCLSDLAWFDLTETLRLVHFLSVVSPSSTCHTVCELGRRSRGDRGDTSPRIWSRGR